MSQPFIVLDPEYTIEALFAYVEGRYAALVADTSIDAVERFGLIGKYVFTAVGLDFDYVAGNAAAILQNDGPEREACTEATIRFCAKFSMYITAAWRTERAQETAREMAERVPLLGVLSGGFPRTEAPPSSSPPPSPRRHRRRPRRGRRDADAER